MERGRLVSPSAQNEAEIQMKMIDHPKGKEKEGKEGKARGMQGREMAP